MRMNRTTKLLCGAMMALVASPSLAHAVDALAARGTISVNSDFSACGTVSFPSSQAYIVGEMTAIGFGSTGDNQENVTLHDVKPILETNRSQVQVCTEGLNFIKPPVAAQVTYRLTASAPGGDTVVVVECHKVSGSVQCNRL